MTQLLQRFTGKNMFSGCLSIDSCRAAVSSLICQLTETSTLMVCSKARRRGSSFQLSCLFRQQGALVKCMFLYCKDLKRVLKDVNILAASVVTLVR